MQEQAIWIVGDWQHPDFRAATVCLSAHVRCATFSTAAEAMVAAPVCPASILLLQSRLGQISSRDVEQLHAAAPLAQLVALLGPWCEGELRSGQPWPGVTRVPWRTWFSRLSRELRLESSPHDVRLPRTATEAERLTSSIASFVGHASYDCSVEIWTASRVEFESLRDSLAVLGLKALWRRANRSSPDSPADIVVIDGWENVPVSSTAVSRSILLLHFPRPEDIVRAQAYGITAVVGLPLLLADLMDVMGKILPRAVAGLRESAA